MMEACKIKIFNKIQYRLIVASHTFSETQGTDTTYILSFNVTEQLKMMVRNVHEVNRERTRISQRRLAYMTQPDRMVFRSLLYLKTGQVQFKLLRKKTWSTLD